MEIYTTEAGYQYIWRDHKCVYVHRMVWEEHNGPVPDGYELDHKDGDKSNNDIDNLRLVTKSQNQWNRGKSKKVAHKNVYYDEDRELWRVIVRAHGKPHFGGRFERMEDAIAKAIELREKLHGEFANHA